MVDFPYEIQEKKANISCHASKQVISYFGSHYTQGNCFFSMKYFVSKKTYL